MKTSITLLVVGILILSGLGAVATITKNTDHRHTETISLSTPTLKEQQNYVLIGLPEATSTINIAGHPALPIISKTYTYPFGTQIDDIQVTFSGKQQQKLKTEIIPAIGKQYISTEQHQTTTSSEKDIEIYATQSPYPEDLYSYRIGAGLDGHEHVIYVTVHYHPVIYTPVENTITYYDEVTIDISYTPKPNPLPLNDQYDLLILCPADYEETLQPFVDYKIGKGISTYVSTLDDIPQQGLDIQEDIKYYIKDALDNWDITYVILIGAGVEGQEVFPVRQAWIGSGSYESYFPSDLYYADIYNATGNFSTWDANDNQRYGEYPNDVDAMDLYPDVYISRLPCNNTAELEDVINKFIYYMDHNKITNKIVQIGGDTFVGDPQDVNEGEYTNEVVLEGLPGYDAIQLWGSNKKLTKFHLLTSFLKGVDFVDFSGHGSYLSFATHPPGDDTVWIPKGLTSRLSGFLWINVDYLFNSKKFPVVVYNACSCSKFSASENCLSWYTLKRPNGGAIATFGASGIGYGSYGYAEPTRLFGWMEVHIFEGLYNDNILGDVWGDCITNYANSFELDDGDYKTIVEVTLFGDPSMAIADGPEPKNIDIPLFLQLIDFLKDHSRILELLQLLPIINQLLGN